MADVPRPFSASDFTIYEWQGHLDLRPLRLAILAS
jgi:hypothetical protein